MNHFTCRIIVFIFLFTLLAPIAPTALPSSNTADQQAMPPHPLLLERVARGEANLPAYLTNPSLAVARGINTPVNAPKKLTGSINALAVVVEFSDKTRTVTAGFFDSLIFSPPVAGPGSVRDYYDEVSYGQVDIVTVNLPSETKWQLAPETYAYYVNGDYCWGSYPRNCQKLAEDIVDAVNSVVDFSNYDNDGDGWADPVMLIHAGRGAEYTGSRNDMWSHAWGMANTRYYDGVYIRDYVLMPEYWASVSSSNSDMTIGVFVHEMGHGFWNLPDLYDRDYSSSGAGDWSLMAGGSWNGYLGNSPAWPDAWSRIQMGFDAPVEVTSNLKNQPIAAIYQGSTEGNIFMLDSPALGPMEYFLLEYRHKSGNSYDDTLPGGGLLIWHVDEAMGYKQNDYECTQVPHYLCNDNFHYLVALEQADGLRQLEFNANQGDAGDPFPGSTGNRNFKSNTNPETSSYYGSAGVDTCIEVTNINETPAHVLTANLQVTCSACGDPYEPDNEYNTATPYNVNGPAQTHTFHAEGDNDWVSFSAVAGGMYTMTTSYLGAEVDTVLSLFGPDGITLLDSNDNYGSDKASRIVWTAVENGLHYLKAQDAVGGGSCEAEEDYQYDISITSNQETTQPLAPSELTAVPVSKTQINLAWTDNSTDEQSFFIERSLTEKGSWTDVFTTTADTTAYQDAGLDCGTEYFYRVRSYNEAGFSAYTNIAGASTLVCTPDAVNDAVETEEDTSLVIHVLANDSDPHGLTLALVSTGAAGNGSAVISGTTTVVYTPAQDYNGPDSFTYVVRNTDELTSTAEVSIVVTPVNDAPIAFDDSATTPVDVSVTVDVLTNDIDVDEGDELSILSMTTPIHGTVSLDGTAVVYTPKPGFSGVDTFTYTISDSHGETATASVSVTVGEPLRRFYLPLALIP